MLSVHCSIFGSSHQASQVKGGNVPAADPSPILQYSLFCGGLSASVGEARRAEKAGRGMASVKLKKRLSGFGVGDFRCNILGRHFPNNFLGSISVASASPLSCSIWVSYFDGGGDRPSEPPQTGQYIVVEPSVEIRSYFWLSGEKVLSFCLSCRRISCGRSIGKGLFQLTQPSCIGEFLLIVIVWTNRRSAEISDSAHHLFKYLLLLFFCTVSR